MGRRFVHGDRRGQFLAILILATLVAGAVPGPVDAASRTAARGVNGMVVTPDLLATEAGLSVLREGGNSVDAAVASALALAVTYPFAGNLGGGGFLLFRVSDSEHLALDFRETAPGGLEPDLFLDEEGRPDRERSVRSGLAVGVPGTARGLWEAHRRWGSRPWAGLVAPAIRLAEKGFDVPPYLASHLARAHGKLSDDPEARRILTRDGEPLQAGERLVQRELAATLRLLARKGADGFYDGPVAEAIVETVTGNGGVMTVADLAGYRTRDRQPLQGTYREHKIVTFPPPSGGGIALLQVLTMLEPFDLAETGFGSSLTVHRMVEAERRAFADRAEWIGDPDRVDVPVDQLLAGELLRERGRGIVDDRATPSDRLAPSRLAEEVGGETLHLSVADRNGGAVAMTVTLNQAFGTGKIARGTGVLLNNEMDDFALAPGLPNSWGLVGADANAVAGGKRPASSMTPTIVEQRGGGARPLMVLGSPGGGTIITSVAQVLINVLDHGMPLQQAVDAPRFHHQWLPDLLYHERFSFPEDVARALRERGHRLELRESPLGSVNSIGIDARGSWVGAADPRRDCVALGY